MRGHIRNGFSNDNLYNFLKYINNTYDIDIYIHTWNFIEANRSWRKLDPKKIKIKEDFLRSYFKDLCHNIKHIVIDDELTIKKNLVGRLTFRWISSLPLLCWKYMWYGQHIGINLIPMCYDAVLNTRFDVFNVVHNNLQYDDRSIKYYLELISECTENNNDIVFTNKENCCGIDNLYIGKLHAMKDLINEFHFNLDSHLATMPPFQEHEVFITAYKMFENIF